MNDQIRWAAQDVDRAVAGIAECEEWAAHYEAEAERVAFDPEVQAIMLAHAARKRQAAADGRDELPRLRKRLADAGG